MVSLTPDPPGLSEAIKAIATLLLYKPFSTTPLIFVSGGISSITDPLVIVKLTIFCGSIFPALSVDQYVTLSCPILSTTNGTVYVAVWPPLTLKIVSLTPDPPGLSAAVKVIATISLYKPFSVTPLKGVSGGMVSVGAGTPGGTPIEINAPVGSELWPVMAANAFPKEFKAGGEEGK